MRQEGKGKLKIKEEREGRVKERRKRNERKPGMRGKGKNFPNKFLWLLARF